MANGFSQNGISGITEHLVPLAEKKLILPRQLLIGGGGAALTLAFLFLAIRIPGLFPLFLLLCAGAVYLTYYLWRYTQVEYEYLIAEGEMTFSAVYGKKSRRDLFTFSVKEAEKIVSYQKEKELCDEFPADRTLFYAASYKDENTLCALLNPQDGKKIRIFFQGTPAAITALRRANPSALKVKNAKAKSASDKKASKPDGEAEKADQKDAAPSPAEKPKKKKSAGKKKTAPKPEEPAEAPANAPEPEEPANEENAVPEAAAEAKE